MQRGGQRHPRHSCRCKGRTTCQSSCYCCCCHRGCRSCRQNGHQQVGKCCRSPLLVHAAPAHAARVQHRTKPRHRHIGAHAPDTVAKNIRYNRSHQGPACVHQVQQTHNQTSATTEALTKMTWLQSPKPVPLLGFREPCNPAAQWCTVSVTHRDCR